MTNTWYGDILYYSYYIAQVVFIAAYSVSSLRTRRLPAYLSLVGFVAFLIGNMLMLNANSALVEAEQIHGDSVGAEMQYLAGRITSSIGFIVAAISSFVFVVKTK